MADVKIQGVVEMNAEGAERVLDRVGDKAVQMAAKTETAANKAGAAVDGIGAGASGSADQLTRAEGRMLASIKRVQTQFELAGKTASQKLEFNIDAKGLDAAKFEPALQKLREVEAAAAKSGRVASASLNSMGMSAAATSAALRSVPAQFTDIITSLQGGQAPLTVFMQQGGQLKDLFGGAGNAAKALGGYVAGLISPMTIAAGAAAALGYAYYKGSGEAQAFATSLIMTGNAAGTTAGQLMDMSRTLSQSTGATRGAVAETLNEIAASGKVSADVLAQVGKAAIDMERAGGQAAAATVKEFVSLGEAPVDAILKLNEKYHFLTAAVYEQIKALQDQGRETDAAKLAQSTYADALEGRIPSLVSNLGLLERGWKSVGDSAKGAWDFMLGVGRQKSIDQQLADAIGKRDGQYDYSAKAVIKIPGQQAVIDALSNEIEARDQLLLIQQKSAETEKAKINWSKESVKYLDNEGKKKAEILRVTNMMTEAGKSQAEIAKVIAQVEEKYAEKKAASVKAMKEDYAELFGRQEQMALIAKELKAETDEIAKANDAYAKSVAALLDPVEREAESIERQLETYGLTRSEIEATTIARLEEAKALATLNGAGDDAIAFYAREIDARKRIQAAAAGIENAKTWDDAVKESQKAAEKAASDWQKTSDKISDSITDALMRGFESGKDFAENLRDTVVNMFKSIVLQPVIRATVVTGLSAAGIAPASASEFGGVGNIASAGSSAYNLYSGGSGLYGSFATSGLGQSLGLSALGQSTGVAASTSMGLTIPGMATEMTSLGSTIGTAIPYVGAAIAAIGLLTGALGKRGGAKTEGDAYGTLYGSALSLSAADRFGDNWITGSNSNAVVESLLAPIGTSVASLITSMGGSASGLSFNLGFSTDPKGTAADNIQSGVMDASGAYVYRNGRNAERGSYSTELNLEVQRMMVAAVRAADVSQIYKDIAGSVDLYSASAEQLTTVLAQLAQITTLRTAFDKINLGADALTTTLISAAGGLDTLTTAASSYYDGYFTSAEKQANLGKSLADQFTALNVAMPTSRAEFRALVESLDRTTVSGQTTVGTLLSMSQTFGTWADAAATATASVAASAESLAAMVTTAQSDLKSAYDTQASALESTRDKFDGFATSLKSFRESLVTGELSPLDGAGKYGAAKQQYDSIKTKARLGDAAAIEQLQSVSQSFLEASRSMYSSGDAYNADYADVLATLDSTESLATRQYNIAVESLSDLHLQVNALVTINDSVLSVADAVNKLYAAQFNASTGATSGSTAGSSLSSISDYYTKILGRQPDQAGLDYWNTALSGMSGSQALSTFLSGAKSSVSTADASAATKWEASTASSSLTSQINDYYTTILGRTAEPSGVAYWTSKLGGLSGSDALSTFLAGAVQSPSAVDATNARAWAKRNKIPGYASGGIAQGTFMVGESGREIIQSPYPVRVLSNAQTNAALSNSDAEIKALREEIRQLRADQAAQHREAMAANYDANDRAASKVVGGQKEVAWRESTKSRYAA